MVDAAKNEPCPRCGSHDRMMIVMTEGKNYAKDVCAECERFFFWYPKPENEDKRKGSTVNLARKYEIQFCEMCLLSQAELPKGETIEGHHVKEHQDGGTDERSNIWGVCTSCHELIHHQRRHRGYFQKRA